MKLVLVSGARPNYMKIAPIVWEIRKLNRQASRGIQFVLVHTGQHYDRQLFEVFFQELDLPDPDYDLAVGAGSHAAQTGEVMLRFEPVLEKEKPDLVVVVGDVNSTLACALTAVKMGIPVGHVEAGLRSFDRSMPEEINRILTDAISDYLFITEQAAKENLLREGIPESKLFFVGNVMIDTLLRHKKQLKSSKKPSILNLMPQNYGVLTLHRPSNVDDKQTFQEIVGALLVIAQRIPIVFPCHPRTRERIKAYGFERYFTTNHSSLGTGICLIAPIGYLDCLKLMSKARFVLTDSGGIQEETTVLGVPCLTLRENTERPVTVTAGTNVVVGTDSEKIIGKTLEALNGSSLEGRIPALWDGKASERIVKILVEQCVQYNGQKN